MDGADAETESTPAAGTGSPRRDRRVAVVAIVVAVAVIVAVIVLHQAEQQPGASGAGKAPTVLAALDAKWSLPPGYFEQINFDLRAPATITGGLFSSQKALVQILNDSQFQTFNATGNTTSHTYSSGEIQSLTLNLALNAGAWYLVISNENATDTALVTVTSAVIATAS